jgi:hypothetical protein
MHHDRLNRWRPYKIYPGAYVAFSAAKEQGQIPAGTTYQAYAAQKLKESLDHAATHPDDLLPEDAHKLYQDARIVGVKHAALS